MSSFLYYSSIIPIMPSFHFSESILTTGISRQMIKFPFVIYPFVVGHPSWDTEYTLCVPIKSMLTYKIDFMLILLKLTPKNLIKISQFCFAINKKICKGIIIGQVIVVSIIPCKHPN